MAPDLAIVDNQESIMDYYVDLILKHVDNYIRNPENNFQSVFVAKQKGFVAEFMCNS